MRRARLAGLLLLALGAIGASGPRSARPAPARLADVLVPGPADSLIVELRRLQSGPVAGEAARWMGLLQYARGEYAAARQSFARAQSRLPEPARSDARCWEALAWLAQGAPGKAQSTLKPLVGPAGPHRDRALLLTAQSLDVGPDPERALPIYDRLLKAARPDPIALARAARLETRLGRPDRARAIDERLLELYPASLEVAARAAAPSGAEREHAWVVMGPFATAAAARDLAERARAAGFDHASVVTERSGGSSRWLVRIGPYESRDEASATGERVEGAIGADYWLVTGR